MMPSGTLQMERLTTLNRKVSLAASSPHSLPCIRQFIRSYNGDCSIEKESMLSSRNDVRVQSYL